MFLDSQIMFCNPRMYEFEFRFFMVCLKQYAFKSDGRMSATSNQYGILSGSA